MGFRRWFQLFLIEARADELSTQHSALSTNKSYDVSRSLR